MTAKSSGTASAAASLRLSELRIPTVPLQQYEHLLNATDLLVAALRDIAQLPPSVESAERAARIAAEALQIVEEGSATENNSNAADAAVAVVNAAGEEAETEQQGHGELVPVSRSLGRSQSAPVQPATLIGGAQQQQLRIPDRSASAAASPSPFHNNTTNMNNNNNATATYSSRVSINNDVSAAAAGSPAPAAPSTLAEGAVGSGVGGTSATVRENIVEGGKLVKLVSDAHPLPGKLWSLQNTTTNTQFNVIFTFGQQSQVEPLGDTTLVRDNVTNTGSSSTSYKISLYPLETKPFVRGLFSGYRMKLSFGPPDSGYVAAVRTTGGAAQSVLERLEEIRRSDECRGYIPLSRALATCLEAGSSFVDVEFPPTSDSVCRPQFEHELPVPVRWERPERFLALGQKSALAAGLDTQSLMWTIPRSSPLLGGSSSRSTSWLVSAAAVLASNPVTVRYILAALRRCTLSDSTAGLYRVEMCHGGIWRNVVVDSLMPCHRDTRECIAARCAADKRDMWGAIVEKAWAKCCGSYAALLGPSSSSSSANAVGCFDALEALMDLTGGVAERFDWRAREVGVFAALQAALLRDSHRSSYEFALVAVLLSNAPPPQQQRNSATAESASASRSVSQQQQHLLDDTKSTVSQRSSLSRSQHQQQQAAALDSPALMMEQLGLIPGCAYRVVTTATADNVRMVLLDNIHGVESVPRNSHVVVVGGGGGSPNAAGAPSSSSAANIDANINTSSTDNAEPLPLHGLGTWADPQRWIEHPSVASACRTALQHALAASARPRRTWSINDTALVNERFVWMDWRDAIVAFEGAGSILVPPELSLVVGGAPPPSAHQNQTAAAAVSAEPETEAASSSATFGRRRAASIAPQSSGVAPAASSTSATTAATTQAPPTAQGYSSVPRSVSHLSTLDLRIPNAFTAATPDWMLELTVRGDTPVTLYCGLHQRDRRGLDPLHPDRHYSALLLSVIGCAASGVWDAVAHSHNGTYWRGRDVQVEVQLEPRAKPYYILPRRYASSSEALAPGMTTHHQRLNYSGGGAGGTMMNASATFGSRMQEQQQQQRELPDARKDIVLSLLSPDGLRRLSPSDFTFRKPTAEVMRAVRYSPVWRFDPLQCSKMELQDYAASLQQQQQQQQAAVAAQAVKVVEVPAADGNDDADVIAERDAATHYFFRVVRQSKTVDSHHSSGGGSSGSGAGHHQHHHHSHHHHGHHSSPQQQRRHNIHDETQQQQQQAAREYQEIESTTVIVNRVPKDGLMW